MIIRLTRNTIVEGRACSVGEEATVKDKVGRSLVLMGKAVEIQPAVEIQHPDPLPEGEGTAVQADATIATTLTAPMKAPTKASHKKK